MLDFETFRRSRRPNNYLIAPQRLCQNARPDLVSLTYPAPAARLMEAYRWIFGKLPRFEVIDISDDGLALEAAQRSRLFRFSDLVSVRVFDVGNGRSTAAIYSRARFGRSDFGVNRARVVSWVGGAAVALAELDREG